MKGHGKVMMQRYDIATGRLVEEWIVPNIDYRNPDVIRCEFCGKEDCTCSDFDIDPDMGDK
jgi:hypothetical protein